MIQLRKTDTMVWPAGWRNFVIFRAAEYIIYALLIKREAKLRWLDINQVLFTFVLSCMRGIKWFLEKRGLEVSFSGDFACGRSLEFFHVSASNFETSQSLEFTILYPLYETKSRSRKTNASKSEARQPAWSTNDFSIDYNNYNNLLLTYFWVRVCLSQAFPFHLNGLSLGKYFVHAQLSKTTWLWNF